MRLMHFALAAALLALVQASPSRASLLYGNPSGQNDDDGAIQGTAIVTLGTNSITITLESLITPTGGPGQEISGVILNLGTAPTSAASFTSAPTGTAVTINSNGTFTQTPNTNLTTGDYTWEVNTSGKVVSVADAGKWLQGGQPNGLIIGPTGFDSSGNPIYNSGTYNYSSGIVGHDPVQGPVTFTLTVPGVTSSTSITSVSLEFGTGPDKTKTANFLGTIITQQAVVPEPSTISLALSGLGMIGLAAWRGRQQRRKEGRGLTARA